MNILIKFTLKNMKEKKFRLALILISITLSTALFFASSAVGPNIVALFSSQMRALVGDADIRIAKESDSYRGRYFYVENFSDYEDETEYIVGGFFGGARYTTETEEELQIQLIGYSLEDMDKFNPVELVSYLDEDFYGRKLIVSYQDAEKYGFKVGDTVGIQAFGEEDFKVQIWGIANPTGLFQPTGNQSNMIMPKDVVTRLTGVPGKVNSALMKAEEGQTLALIEKLRADFPGYEIEEAMPLEDIQESTAMVSTLFNIMLILVIFISIFIIYTSFKVIMMERLPVIGTFRSVGATKRSTNIILMGESLFYGVIGGGIGILLGIGILYAMTSTMAYNPWSGTTTAFSLTFSAFHVISSILMAVILSLVSSLIPIIQVNKIAVKDIVLNKIETKKKSASNRNYVGFILMTVFFIIPMTPLAKGSLLINVLCMVIAIIGLIMTVPVIIKFAIVLFEKIFTVFFGNEGAFAVKNIRNNKNVVNNIVLLTIGIASLFMINVISYSVGVEVVNVYNSGDFEIWSWVNQIDERNLDRVKAVDGVIDVHAAYDTGDVKLADSENSIGRLTGINPYKFFDYWQYELIGDKEEMINTLDENRHMILNRSLADKFELVVGDTITLDIEGKHREYKITGLVNTLMNNGQMALISDKYFKADFGPRYYSDIYIKTEGDPDVVNEALVNKFKNTGIWTMTMDEMQKNNEQSNDQILGMLQGFSILTMVIGIFGVFNNYLVNMMSRKRPLAMYRSVGMSMKQMRKMLYLESFSGGLIGGLSGVLGGMIFVTMVGYVMISMNLPVALHINPMLVAQSIIGGIVVAVVASISPVIRSSKMKIIEAIKYE